MKTTGNLGLKKPDGTDIVDITDLNGNMDILDTAVKAVQDHAADTVKHITATERTAWNAKASTAVATTTAAGLMAGADKSKLDSVAQGANNYVHPSTHSPSVIVQDSSNRFVTDAEKAAWNGKANLVTTPQQTTADVTYYVRTDGNDGNTGLGNTAGGAFRTIGKAVGMVPKCVNHVVTINVAAGTYAEIANLSGFHGIGNVKLMGDVIYSTSRNVNAISMYGNSCFVEASGFNCLTPANASAIDVTSCVGALVGNCGSTVASTNNGININLSNIRATGCTFSNKLAAVNVVNASVAYIENFTGTGNTWGNRSTLGSYVTAAGTRAIGTNGDSNEYGVLNYGGVVNPWGDNTQDSRAIVWGGSLVSSTTTTPSAWNLLRYGISTNQQGGYNATTGVFTSPQTGWYKIKATVQLQSAPIGAYSIAVLQNGSTRWIADYKNVTATQHLNLGGDMLLYLPAGQTVTIQLHTDSNSVVIVNGMDTTHLEIVRVA